MLSPLRSSERVDAAHEARLASEVVSLWAAGWELADIAARLQVPLRDVEAILLAIIFDFA